MRFNYDEKINRQNFWDWFDDISIHDLICLEDEDNLMIEKEFEGMKELVTMDEDNHGQNDIYYNLLYNLKDEESCMESNYWKIICAENGCIKLTRIGDVIIGMKLCIDKDENINEWFNYSVILNIGGTDVIHSSIKLLTTFSKLINHEDIVYGEEYIEIPLSLTNFFNNGKLHIISLPFHELKLTFCDDDKILSKKIKINVCWAFYNNDARRKIIKGMEFITLKTKKMNYIADDHIVQIDQNIKSFSSFIIIWYTIDNSYFAEIQSLQPSILKIEMQIMFENHFLTKELDNIHIKKIKCRNYTGFFISINRFSFSDIINFFGNKRTNLGLFDKFVNWNNIDVKFLIHFSNFHPGATINIENYEFNIGKITNGLFNLIIT